MVKQEEARNERRQLREELHQLKSLYDTQRNELISQLHTAQAQHAEQLHSVQVKHADIAAQLRSAQAERNEYETQAKECDRFLRSCEHDLASLRERNAQMEVERDSARVEALEMRGQLARANDLSDKLRSEFDVSYFTS